MRGRDLGKTQQGTTAKGLLCLIAKSTMLSVACSSKAGGQSWGATSLTAIMPVSSIPHLALQVVQCAALTSINLQPQKKAPAASKEPVTLIRVQAHDERRSFATSLHAAHPTAPH